MSSIAKYGICNIQKVLYKTLIAWDISFEMSPTL